MTIAEFTKKWAPVEEPQLVNVFKEDFLTLLQSLKGTPIKSTALEVLSDIDGAELIIDTVEYSPHHSDGRIRWGKQGQSEESGIISMYSLATGQSEYDWLHLLRCIAKQSLK